MGYPTEIANSANPPPMVPPRSGWRRLLEMVAAVVATLRWRHRPRRRADAPASYGQGVDAAAPPITHADRARLACDEIARRI